MEYVFLVESAKTENITFPFKTALSKINGQTNGKGSRKWIFHREQGFTSNYFSLLKILFQFKNLLRTSYQLPKCSYSSFL